MRSDVLCVNTGLIIDRAGLCPRSRAHSAPLTDPHCPKPPKGGSRGSRKGPIKRCQFNSPPGNRCWLPAPPPPWPGPVALSGAGSEGN